MGVAVSPSQEDMDWLVEVINEYSTATRVAADELGGALTQLRGGPPLAAGLSVEDAVAVANAWFEVFRAAPDAQAVAATLNELLDQASPAVVAVCAGDTVRGEVQMASAVTDTTRLAAWGALCLLDLVASAGLDRLGLCAGDRCVDVYVDRSPRRNRRYCSQLCQTRERVHRFRERS